MAVRTADHTADHTEGQPPSRRRLRSTAGAGALVAALAVAYVAGQSGGSAAHAADAGTTSDQRTITALGTGTVTVTPDQVRFEVDVQQTRPQLTDALDAANAGIRKVRRTLLAQGVPAASIQSSGLSMYPVYHRVRGQASQLRGYQVEESLSVVDDLKKAGGVISAVVATRDAGARVQDISLSVKDADAKLTQARKDAVAKAQATAQVYADATGSTLGPVVSLTEQPDDSGFGYAQDSAASVPASSVPISPGSSSISVTVQIAYAIG